MCEFICEFPPQYSFSSQDGTSSTSKNTSGQLVGIQDSINVSVIEVIDIFSVNITNTNSIVTGTLSANTLNVTEIEGFTAIGDIDFTGQIMTNVNIDSGTIDGTIIGSSTPSDGYFVNLYADNVDLDGGNIDGTAIGITSPSTGIFSTLISNNIDLNGGNIDGTAIGVTSPSTGSFTTLDASGDVNFLGASGTACFQWDQSTSKLTLCGDLQVDGTTTTLNSETLTVDDVIITLADFVHSSNDGKDRGLEFNYYNTSQKLGFFGFDNSTERFTYFTNATNTSEVISGTLGDAEFNSLYVNCVYLNTESHSICGDGTDLILGSTGDIILNTSSQISIPDGEILIGPTSTIGSGSDGGLLIGTTGFDVTIPIDTSLIFGTSGSNIINDGTDLYIQSNGGINLQSNENIEFSTGSSGYILVPDNTTVKFGLDGKEIYSDGTDLFITSDRKIIFSALDFEGLPGITGGTTGGIETVTCIEFVNSDHQICGDGSSITLSTTGAFYLDVTENIFIQNDTKLMFGTTGNYIYSNLTDLFLVSEEDIIFQVGPTGQIVVPQDNKLSFGTSNTSIYSDGTDLFIGATGQTVKITADDLDAPGITGVSLWIDYKKFDHENSIWISTREIVSGNHYYYWYNTEPTADITYLNKDLSHDLKGFVTKGFLLTKIYFSYEVLGATLNSVTARVVKKTINSTTGAITFTSLTTSTTDLNSKTSISTHYGSIDISTTYLDEHENISVELEFDKQASTEIKFNGMNLIFNEKIF